MFTNVLRANICEYPVHSGNIRKFKLDSTNLNNQSHGDTGIEQEIVALTTKTTRSDHTVRRAAITVAYSASSWPTKIPHNGVWINSDLLAVSGLVKKWRERRQRIGKGEIGNHESKKQNYLAQKPGPKYKKESPGWILGRLHPTALLTAKRARTISVEDSGISRIVQEVEQDGCSKAGRWNGLGFLGDNCLQRFTNGPGITQVESPLGSPRMQIVVAYGVPETFIRV
ncbi:hypothetical protein DFH07DRAFT_783658 [Mycena maculata]|uniref:Uncharacterized protein n=1 Tax=Mycena maculata TaxID=230809 RepID=A0AAD7MM60_9AGAR|nr:hypothetical protein DFH07DRAFT_783658 [Mycena maculata]